MKKVVYFIPSLGTGGIEKMVISWIENIDKNKVQVDIVTQGIKNKKAKSYLELLGCNVIDMPFRQRQMVKKLAFMTKLFRLKKYDIVHVHTSVAFDFLALVIAKYFCVRHRIIHSHNTNSFSNSFIKRLLQRSSKFFLKRYATAFFACSKKAGSVMFGDDLMGKVVVVKNGIDIEKFKFNKTIREEIRDKHNLSEKLVLGHVGRFNEQKNHSFVIDVFYEITKIKKNSVLLLIGEGELFDFCRNKVDKLDISDKVLFLGSQDNVNNYMQAMDGFIFPSLYEGLGIVLVEAQCAGLECIVSNEIVEEAILSQRIEQFDLQLSPSDWAHNVLKLLDNNKNRQNAWEDIVEKQFSIKESAQFLEDYYFKLS